MGWSALGSFLLVVLWGVGALLLSAPADGEDAPALGVGQLALQQTGILLFVVSFGLIIALAWRAGKQPE
jgi:hypothetical protein